MENTLFLFSDTTHTVPTEKLLSKLTPPRLEKALQYKHEQDKRICAWSEILLFYALRKLRAPKLCVFWDNKPHLGADGYHFSLSHTKNQIALLLAAVPVGVDIEMPRVLGQADALCARLFTEKERAAMVTTEDFFRFWTAKEAYVKFTGEGFSHPFSSILVDFTLGTISDANAKERMAHITPFSAFDSTIGCICAKDPIAFHHCTVTDRDIM